ncbi:hypothetical protein [Leptospira kirschneri]|uniref:hypothetical protein n=1 Tax=Leptospira kirschneri TaxID=29507 RepID=UPI0002929C5E|nr:hypothetical protein [Leptospira kirschneri]EKO62478.1 hypothetical protein LEP1GSC082_4594 [Leptospira kirschneri str. H2]
MELKPGQLVKKKKDHIFMAVEEILSDNTIQVCWWTGNKFERDIFDADDLEYKFWYPLLLRIVNFL